MPKNTTRAQVWHAFYSQAKTDAQGVKDLVLSPKPHAAPFPTRCTAQARVQRGRATGIIEFGPGEEGRLVRCFHEDSEQEFTDVVAFAHHLKEMAYDHLLFIEGQELMDTEPELWSNIDR